MTDTLLFVYNSDTGFVQQELDRVHKVVSPETYSCNLCMLTYGVFTQKRQWKMFINSLPLKTEFLHKNDFFSRYPDQKITLPALLKKDRSDNLTVLASSDVLNDVHTLNDLMALVKNIIGEQ